MSKPSLTPPSRPISGLLASLSILAVAGCYGFAGGGFPPEIETVAVLPFENLTSDPTLAQEVAISVREAVQNRLGLRQAGESDADALVRGTITRYVPDVPIAYTGNDANNQVNVTRRMVQMTVSVEILNQRTGKTLWEQSGMRLEGAYEQGQESEGRQKALDQLITNIVDGARSQW